MKILLRIVAYIGLGLIGMAISFSIGVVAGLAITGIVLIGSAIIEAVIRNS